MRSTVARRLSTLCSFYRYCHVEGLSDRNPAANIRRPKVDYESRTHALDRNELGCSARVWKRPLSSADHLHIAGYSVLANFRALVEACGSLRALVACLCAVATVRSVVARTACLTWHGCSMFAHLDRAASAVTAS